MKYFPTDVEKAELRLHANLVQDEFDNAETLGYTERSKAQFEWAQKEFKERHPGRDQSGRTRAGKGKSGSDE